MKDSHGEPTSARTTTAIWKGAGRRPLDRERDRKGEKGEERRRRR
jgi:hypothetical protein